MSDDDFAINPNRPIDLQAIPNDVLDQGCEFCDAMVTDRLDLPDDPEFNGQLAHAWVCSACWNRHWQEHHGMAKP